MHVALCACTVLYIRFVRACGSLHTENTSSASRRRSPPIAGEIANSNAIANSRRNAHLGPPVGPPVGMIINEGYPYQIPVPNGPGYGDVCTPCPLGGITKANGSVAQDCAPAPLPDICTICADRGFSPLCDNAMAINVLNTGMGLLPKKPPAGAASPVVFELPAECNSTFACLNQSMWDATDRCKSSFQFSDGNNDGYWDRAEFNQWRLYSSESTGNVSMEDIDFSGGGLIASGEFDKWCVERADPDFYWTSRYYCPVDVLCERALLKPCVSSASPALASVSASSPCCRPLLCSDVHRRMGTRRRAHPHCALCTGRTPARAAH